MTKKATLTAFKNNCKVDNLYQWDTGQILEIYGLSLPALPEIHFACDCVGTAEVCKPTMDAAGVLRVNVPDHLLEKSGTLRVYVYSEGGGTASALCCICIPVLARPKPVKEEEFCA